MLKEKQVDLFIKLTSALIIIVLLAFGYLYYNNYKRPTQNKTSLVEGQIIALEKKVKKSPRDKNLRFYLAKAYYNNKQTEDAKRQLEQIIKLDSKDKRAYLTLGFILKKEGKQNFSEAEKNFNQVIELGGNKEFSKVDIDLKNAYFYLGQIYFDKKQYKKAIYFYLKSSKIGDTDSDTFKNIGKCYFLLKDYKKAQENYDKALKYVPNYAEVYVDLGDLYKVQNNKAKAKQNYEKALKYNQSLTEAKEALEELK